MAQLAGNAHWAEISSLFASSLDWRARLTSLDCKSEYLVFALSEETAAQAVVNSIIWAFSSGSQAQSREMNARSCAFHSVYPKIFRPIK